MTEPDNDPSDEHKVHLSDADKILIHHTKLPQTAISHAIDTVIVRIGKTASWLWLVTVGVIIYAVVGRYAFGQGSVTLEEWQWHIAGAAWLITLSYTLAVDDHVRVDVLHERFSLKAQGWIEFFGLVLLLLPFLGFAIYEAIPYAMSSYEQGETSQSPAGLSNRWILKSIFVISLILLAIAAFSRLFRVTALLFGFPTPYKAGDETESGEVR